MPEDTAPEETGTETPQTPPTQEEPASPPFGFQSYPSSKSEEPQISQSPPQPPQPPQPPLQPSVQPPTQEQAGPAPPIPPAGEQTSGRRNFLSRLKKVLIILAVLVILAVGGVFAYQTLIKRLGGSSSGQEEPTPSPQALPVETSPPQASSSFSSGIYQNSQYGFTIEPPGGWQETAQAGSNQSLIVSFTNTQQAGDAAIITVQQAKLQDSENFAQYIQNERQKIQTDAKIISEIKGVLAGGEAYQFDFTGKQSTPDVRGRAIYILREGNVFVLGATTTAAKWDQYLPIFEKSLGSFKFIPQR